MNSVGARPGRNEPCPCGSGRRYKHCCGSPTAATSPPAAGFPPTAGLPPAAATLPGAIDPREIGALVALIDQDRLGDAEQKTRSLLKAYPGAGMLWKILSVALVRQRKEAMQELRRAAELMPNDAEVHRNLGAALHDEGQWAAALPSLQRALALAPDDVDTLVDAADATKGVGRAREAVPLYERALERNPRLAEAHNNLGNALLELRQYEDAAARYRRALELKPDDAQILCNLGNALTQLGRLDEAVALCQRAMVRDRRLSVAPNNLGQALAALGRREDAVASFRQALALDSGYVDALNNLGNVLRDLGQRREAAVLHRRAVERDPARAESHCNLGTTLFESRRVEEAVACFRKALALKPDYAPAHVSLAAALRQQRRPADAEASCRAALAIDPNYVEAQFSLGELKADRGEFAEAEQLFRRAIELKPDFSFAYSSIATHRAMTLADNAWLEGAEALLAKPLPLAQEVSLRYALGKYCDDVGRYDDAFGYYRQANELSRRHGASYDGAKLTERIARIIRSFDAAYVRESRPGASASELPVFIVGMPRSGTSLTEQILASHPSVFGAGEVIFWNDAFAACEKAQLEGREVADLIPGMAKDYLARLASLSGGTALRVVDKMPANFLYAGLIHAAFPRARIIHMQRHPIDTCLSIYFQNFFNIGPYAHDLGDLAHYYGEYRRITDHWRAVLPATTLLEIPYEALIEDQEGWTRRLLDFVGLPWDPRCLDFHRTDRVVITASKWQVRQKIHAGSTGRWRHYEKFVGPLQRLTDT